MWGPASTKAKGVPEIRNTPSTAGNSVTSSERPSPEPFLKKRGVPRPYWGGENSGFALEASNALSYRAWGIPAVLSRRIQRIFQGYFLSFALQTLQGKFTLRMSILCLL